MDEEKKILIYAALLGFFAGTACGTTVMAFIFGVFGS